eukprot:690026-Ditylum_brightwellii.AAC.1
MVEEEECAKAEKAANSKDEDEEDHDNRCLPKKRWMEVVMKNKNEFYDLTPEDKEEIKSVKLSLNLNLALVYFNTKVLFRQATIYFEKKKCDDAKKDLDTAGKTTPDNKAIQKLQTRLEEQIKRQKAKEKNMAQTFFGQTKICRDQIF